VERKGRDKNERGRGGVDVKGTKGREMEKKGGEREFGGQKWRDRILPPR